MGKGNAVVAKEPVKSNVKNVTGVAVFVVSIVMVMDRLIVIIAMVMDMLIVGIVMALELIENIMARRLCVVNVKGQAGLSVNPVMELELKPVKNAMAMGLLDVENVEERALLVAQVAREPGIVQSVMVMG